MLTEGNLRQVSIFSELSAPQLQAIFRLVQVRTFPAEAVIFHQGEPGEAVYFVSRGLVKISSIAADGREKIIHFMEDGQVFGEVVLFEGGPYPATAQAMAETEVGALRNQDLYQLLLQQGELAVSVMRLLARRLRMAQQQVHDLALKDAYTRVGELLLRLVEESGRQQPDGVHLRLRATREELANLAGTTRETFTRMLGELRQRGLVVVARSSLVIPDLERLRAEFV